MFILLPVQCSLVHRPWISFSALQFSVLIFLPPLSAPCDLLLTLDLLQRSAFALFDHCVSTPCGSITAVPRWISQFFALLDHCVSSPCSSITAVPRWIFFSALQSTLDLESPSTLCIRPARSLRFSTMWLDHCNSTLDLLHPAIYS